MNGIMNGHYIEFQNVSKSFGTQAVLRDVNFHMDRGETAVIMGRSGVGKSVSLKLILGFLKADAGRIFVAGQDVTDFREEQMTPVRRKVTMVFQSGALFDSLTVAQNVAFPMQALGNVAQDHIEERVAELLEMLEVTPFADKLPSELSTGTKRAVAIARALAQDPEAILYDEPTTMVDPLMATHTGDLILKLKEKFHKTSIVVTHDTHLARKLADRIIFLQEGRVTFFGTWHEFEDSQEPFIRNFRLQDELIPALDVTLATSAGG
ncbi:MAG TPA: ATP-binding cassette domain-containing protein [Verrucomicrobiae bacterium]|nr:ATP-binding cassette domain-containing protein [Verrucomicrobiae bacterium]